MADLRFVFECIESVVREDGTGRKWLKLYRVKMSPHCVGFVGTIAECRRYAKVWEGITKRFAEQCCMVQHHKKREPGERVRHRRRGGSHKVSCRDN